jgi:hypothetical protein
MAAISSNGLSLSFFSANSARFSFSLHSTTHLRCAVTRARGPLLRVCTAPSLCCWLDAGFCTGLYRPRWALGALIANATGIGQVALACALGLWIILVSAGQSFAIRCHCWRSISLRALPAAVSIGCLLSAVRSCTVLLGGPLVRLLSTTAIAVAIARAADPTPVVRWLHSRPLHLFARSQLRGR